MEIGTRIRYTPPPESRRQGAITGTVMDIYPGYRSWNSEESRFYSIPDYVSVRVDQKPKWWNYTGDLIALESADIEIIS